MFHKIRILILLLSFIAACTPRHDADAFAPAPKQVTLSKPRDLWASIRGNLRLPNHSHHESVSKQIRWLQDHQEAFNKVATRSAPYLYFVHHEVLKHDMPSELALLPIIESAYDPFAYSHAGASGLWQLMPGTAMGFGLKQNWWYDGRRDIFASTKTALDYLSYLNKYFDGDWLLTLAAYDSGEGTVQNAVQKNLHANKDTQFWSLQLPRETQSYIPRLLAISAIIKNPSRYGIELPAIYDTPYFAKVDLDFQMDLSLAAKLAGISKEELFKLNPGFNRWATSPNGPYHIVLPVQNVEPFRMNLAKLPKQERVKWIRYKVEPNDNLIKIANNHKVKLAEMMRINHIKGNLIHPGQTLIIPYAKTPKWHERLKLVFEKQQQYGPKKIEYNAKKDELIASIGKRFGIKPGAIRFWNHLSGARLKEATKIVMWKSKPNRSAKYYIVQSGDSLGKIANSKNTTLAKLYQLNPTLKNKPTIRPKEKIRYA